MMIIAHSLTCIEGMRFYSERTNAKYAAVLSLCSSIDVMIVGDTIISYFNTMSFPGKCFLAAIILTSNAGKLSISSNIVLSFHLTHICIGLLLFLGFLENDVISRKMLPGSHNFDF